MNPVVDRQPIRILQIVGMMNRGGAETWLMHVLRNIDREKFQIDFLVCATGEKCAYDDEIIALGSRLIPCLNPSNPLKFGQQFKQILRDYGPYDVVHGHIHHYNGLIFRLASQMGVPIRVCHSHIDSSALEANASWLRRGYLKLMQRWIAKYATVGLGCSEVASANLFGKDWQTDPRWQMYYCGIDLTTFDRQVDAQNVRQQLGIPADAFVVGHVGRFQEQKNHPFLVDIFAEIYRRESKAYLLLLGAGPLRSAIEQKVAAANLTERVMFAGSRPDVPELMLGAMDAFVMPSLCEGLPLVGIEVQAAGLPTFFADTITPEVHIVKELVRSMSLSQSAAEWAQAVLAIKDGDRALSQPEALDRVQQSQFNIQVGVPQLMQIYTGGRLNPRPSRPVALSAT